MLAQVFLGNSRANYNIVPTRTCISKLALNKRESAITLLLRNGVINIETLFERVSNNFQGFIDPFSKLVQIKQSSRKHA